MIVTYLSTSTKQSEARTLEVFTLSLSNECRSEGMMFKTIGFDYNGRDATHFADSKISRRNPSCQEFQIVYLYSPVDRTRTSCMFMNLRI